MGAAVAYRTKTYKISYTGSILSYGIGDFNRDGRLDFAFGGPETPFKNVTRPFEIISVTSSGSVLDSTKIMKSVPKAVHAREMFVGDLNGDGVDDFFSANHGYDTRSAPGERNTLMLSSGDKLVNASGNLPARNEFSHHVGGGDIDNDGDIDLFTGGSNWEEFGPYFLINDGRGGFTQRDEGIPDRIGKGYNDASNSVYSSLLTDINGDGFLDLVAGFTNDASTAGVTYLNNGKGTFLPETEAALPRGVFGAKKTFVTDIISVDINRDGSNDLVLATASESHGGQKLQILINDRTGHFRDETKARIKQDGKGQWDQTIQAADIDNDGDMDLIAQADLGTPTTQTMIWINSSGKFKPAPASMLKDFQGTIIALDFNKDGRMDFMSYQQGGKANGWIGTDKWTFKTHLNTSTKAAYLWGTAYKDNLKGDSGNNKLVGGGGNDILTGGKGKDAFVFDALLKRNADTIKDFSVKDDSIWLENAIFQGVGWGTPANPRLMAADQFKLYGDEGDAKIIYNKASGGLFYDADGSGDGGMIKFAQVAKNLKLTAADFYVI
ncbi:FG-GAP-like repeat-containing protein [Microvirga pudoricolor]|uniref:FG-GAP-like repeat-containing protein n=1 Tax=Microvirga pudoricolor TaxID=2778729 RepID=UPI0019522E53|nr:FG-GAP-like repeat-containing protein [Microvirga pudoricolor]MBM6594013.1 VCBS repeat-containing protein [Microvirga pudoricolor]